MAWTNERIERLRALWIDGVTASEIADILGGVSRNAVIGKAHRLGLTSRPAPVHEDPIRSMLGKSVELDSILAWRSPIRPDNAYVSEALEECLRASVLIATQDEFSTEDARPLVTLTHVIRCVLAYGTLGGHSPWPRAFVSALARAGTSPAVGDADVALLEKARGSNGNSATKSVLRWDVAVVLYEATLLRRETNLSFDDIGIRHFVVACFFRKEGQFGLRETGCFSVGYEETRDALADSLVESASPYSDDKERWSNVASRLREQPLLIPPSERLIRPHFSSDYTPIGAADPIGTTQDARALADLILLESVDLPLAIGLLGKWGSGKTTLMRRLQAEVRQQTLAERQTQPTKIPEEQAGLGRVRNVVQVEFNAWSFADSSNLWASLTAEIFDQLAAGGIDQYNEERGAQLVANIAARVSRESLEMKTAQASALEHSLSAEAFQQRLQEARDRKSVVGATAMTQVIQELIPTPAPERRIEASEKESQTAWAVLREALIGRGDATTRFSKGLATVSASVHLLVQLSHLRRRSLAMWSIGIGAAAVIVALILFALRSGWIAAITIPWIAPKVTLLTGLALAVWPFVGAAVRFLQSYRERRQALLRRFLEEEKEASTGLAQAEAARDTAEEKARSGQEFIARYAPERAVTSPSRMLQYLLKDSEEISLVRQRLGLLSVIRRCFEQLSEVVKRMKSSGEEDAIERVILYIDDLDRCSPSQVVSILEAINLLLAFDCFVVVVAIDAAWLKHSLDIHHKQLSGGTPGSSHPSAEDYLEKIFQIAFSVPPLSSEVQAEDPTNFSRYVDHLLGLEESSENTSGVEESGRARGMVGTSVFVAAGPFQTEVVDPPRLQRITLSIEERKAVHSLAPLAAKSPRAVKRLVNIYRLMRLNSRDGGEAYPEMLFALACEISLPTPLMQVFESAIERSEPTVWASFIAHPETIILSRDTQQEVPLFSLQSALREAGRIRNYDDAAKALQETAGRALRLEEMREAIKTVRRYSFRVVT